MAKKTTGKPATKKAQPKKTEKVSTEVKVTKAAEPNARFDGSSARIAAKAPETSAEFNILDPASADRAKALQSQMLTIAARRVKNPRPVSFRTADTMRRRMSPLPHFVLQYGIDSYGLPQSGVVELIGWPSCGKTSLTLTIASHIMLTRNAPFLYMSCEGEDKQMATERMLRCMSAKPQIAAELLQRIHIERCVTLSQLQPKMHNWAKAQREGFGSKEERVEGLPMDIPLVIAIDPFSRLMSEAEAQGNVVWDDFATEKMHEPGTGSNFGHSKFANAFTRWLQAFCDRYNVLIICVHQQTEKIDFGNAGKSNPNEPDFKRKLRNPNYIGGKALEGLACVSIVVAVMWEVADATKRIIGKMIAARVHKQAHGEGGRSIQWMLRTNHNDRDVPGKYLDPALHFGTGMMKILKDEQLLALRQGEQDKLYSSKELNLKGLAADQMDSIIHARPAVLDQIGKTLRISGYYDPIAEMLSDTGTLTRTIAKEDAETETQPDTEATTDGP
jgi:RecA/RadA recombinase